MWTEFCVLLHFVARASGFVNLAHTPAQQLQGAANMSKPPQDPAWSANKAVDGNTSQELLTTCAVMDYTKNYNSVWWKVRLGRRFNVAYLEVYFRSSTITRATGYYFYSYDSTDVFDPNSLHPNNLIYHHNPISGCPASIQNINVNRLAQEIVYINKRPQDHISTCIGADSQKTTVEICEVKVMGCDANRYSNGCGKKCDGKCKSHQCDAFNGSCIYGCADPNALTIDCLVCQDGQYISNKQCKPCQGHCKDGTPCNKLTGKCDNGCNNHWTGSFCETCSLGYYGDDCNSECGKCAGNDVCDNQSGDCPGECLGNWQKPKCNACSLGYYGDDCNSECGKCAGNDGCDSHSGDCAGECLGNWQKPKCNVCKPGFYNSTINCLSGCGHCRDNTTCDNESGRCPYGCEEHFEAPYCQVCEDGFYNKTCSAVCGRCRSNEECDKETGECKNGCQLYFKPPLCHVCNPGFYNSTTNCFSKCGHCQDSATCDNESGQCTDGCELYFKEPYCQVCMDGYYGDNCKTECGSCLNMEVCDKQNGTCYHGCADHFKEPKCDVCEDGFYNKNCSAVCGKCVNNDPCDKETGKCRNECQLHFKPPLCQECLDGFYGSTCNATCGYCKDKQPCDKDSGECVHGCKPHYEQPLCEECSDGFHGSTCNSTCGNCTDGQPCDKNTGKCLSGCRPHYKPPFCKVKSTPQTGDEETNTGAIAGGVVAVLIVVVIVGLAGFFFKRRQGVNKRDPAGHVQIVSNDRKKGSKGNKYADISDNSLERSQEEHTDAALSGDDGGYYNTAEITAYIRTQDLHRVILEKNKKENNVFLDEYKRLPVGNTDKCKIGQQKGNVVKNRFKTTFPYDHSRVILTEKWTDNDNDYINANFIKNCNGDKAYIAAQGPKKVTLADFWRMIWQENVKLVVMLTNIVENGKNKCTQYWPEKDKGMDVGPCKIKLLEETEYAFHTYRKFTVQQNNSNTRTIAQFHYTAWPDHGTPEELGLVQFHRAVTQKYQTGGLMLVHCSAGVGRTGTFIGLDSLLQQGREFGRINVFEFVNQMREDRMTMVQTAEQYIFLHKALLCGFQENNTMIKEDNIPTKINSLLQDTSPLNQRALYKEYKVLQTLNPAFDDKDKEDGQTPDNRGKNYDLKILPVSKYRPYLTTYIKGRNDYINAVCVPSFTAPGAFILTQFPLKDTEVDLWRLCMDHDVNALVVLGDTNEGVSWIPQKGSTSFCTPYSLTTENTGSGISGVTQDTMVISIEDQRKELDVFYIPFGNDNAILKGVELLLEKEKQISFTSVIMSKDGAERVGVFCVLHNVLQQLRMDKEVDIFTAVRQVQTRRPEVISKLDEYRRCYELVPVSISEDGIYANM
uniref:protein-tyrosine-phosphatase n=1 Tax=Crassostrea virginica TaxID=6565 RepID=A0A8B8BUH9_CRAVI|nr:uncharacterized protein LOC111112922 isoform X2 [Crassostrea virginica]